MPTDQQFSHWGLKPTRSLESVLSVSSLASLATPWGSAGLHLVSAELPGNELGPHSTVRKEPQRGLSNQTGRLYNPRILLIIFIQFPFVLYIQH